VTALLMDCRKALVLSVVRLAWEMAWLMGLTMEPWWLAILSGLEWVIRKEFDLEKVRVLRTGKETAKMSWAASLGLETALEKAVDLVMAWSVIQLGKEKAQKKALDLAKVMAYRRDH